MYDYNLAIQRARTAGFLDPFALAAEFAHRFVHPFVDGNERVCRMLMNSILFCYVGVVVPLGEREESREAYLGVLVKASESEIGGDGWEGEKTPWAELSSLIVLEACGRLGGLRDRLRTVA